MIVTVTAQIPKERAAGKDEKPEDKARLDKEFKDKQKKLEDKLAQEQGYGKWIYLVSNWTVDSLLKDRAPAPRRKERGTEEGREGGRDRLLPARMRLRRPRLILSWTTRSELSRLSRRFAHDLGMQG